MHFRLWSRGGISLSFPFWGTGCCFTFFWERDWRVCVLPKQFRLISASLAEVRGQYPVKLRSVRPSLWPWLHAPRTRTTISLFGDRWCLYVADGSSLWIVRVRFLQLRTFLFKWDPCTRAGVIPNHHLWWSRYGKAEWVFGNLYSHLIE